MVSVHNNSGANAALRVIRLLQAEKAVVQTRVTSGLRIGRAEEDAAYWSVKSTLRSDYDTISTVRDGMTFALGVLDTACMASDAILSNLQAIRNNLMQGREGDGNRAALDNDILARSAAIAAAVTGASFNGINLLYHQTGQSYALDFVTGVVRERNNRISVQKETLDLNDFALIDDTFWKGKLSRTSSNATGPADSRRLFADYGNTASWIVSLYHRSPPDRIHGFATQAEIDSMIGFVTKWIDAATDVFAGLGSVRRNLQTQSDFLAEQHDNGMKAVGRLVDAAMSDESVRLKAMEVREDLAFQALHMANVRADDILALFR